jgi:DNA-binding GntR family transcriptional regulator
MRPMTLGSPRPLKTAAPLPRATRSEELQARLADAIVSGRLAPGAPLDEVQIATEYSVSRTPVREALRQLSSSGLVEIRPHRGAVVAKPDHAQLNDMFAVMGELESLCAAQCAVRMNSASRQALDELHGAMASLVRDLPRLRQCLSRGPRLGHAAAAGAVPAGPVRGSRPPCPLAPGARPRRPGDPAR